VQCALDRHCKRRPGLRISETLVYGAARRSAERVVRGNGADLEHGGELHGHFLHLRPQVLNLSKRRSEILDQLSGYRRLASCLVRDVGVISTKTKGAGQQNGLGSDGDDDVDRPNGQRTAVKDHRAFLHSENFERCAAQRPCFAAKRSGSEKRPAGE
jgi:hypothetical protein